MNDFFRSEEAYKVAYDLTLCHEVHQRGSVMVWLTWNRITGVPCIILTPNDPHLSHERIIPCVVPLTTCFQWDEERGDPENCNLMAAIFCANLGFNPFNVKNVLKVQSYIRDYLEDLVRMPPMPNDARQVVAEALITDNATGKTVLKEISDHA